MAGQRPAADLKNRYQIWVPEQMHLYLVLFCFRETMRPGQNRKKKQKSGRRSEGVEK